MKNKIEWLRLQDGRFVLGVDNHALSPEPSQKLFNHSPDGFNIGYGGSGPAQSALAILLHVLGDKDKAIRLHQDFKWEFLAKSEYQRTRMGSFEVDIKEWADSHE